MQVREYNNPYKLIVQTWTMAEVDVAQQSWCIARLLLNKVGVLHTRILK
jgi:hypothetical protein